VILVGGATPHSLYNEVWILSLKNLACSHLEVLGKFEARYEHSAFFPIKIVSSETGDEVAKTEKIEKTYDSSRLWIFAGANIEENKNDFWELNFESQQWIKLSQNGEIPSPRTYHTTSACKYSPVILIYLCRSIENTVHYFINFMQKLTHFGSRTQRFITTNIKVCHWT
jgi:hypothetical protein